MCDPFYFFRCDWTAAQWAHGVLQEPLLDAGGVEIVANVAGQGSDERVFSEVDQADQARFLGLEDIGVEFDTEERVNHIFGHVELVVF